MRRCKYIQIKSPQLCSVTQGPFTHSMGHKFSSQASEKYISPVCFFHPWKNPWVPFPSIKHWIPAHWVGAQNWALGNSTTEELSHHQPRLEKKTFECGKYIPKCKGFFQHVSCRGYTQMIQSKLMMVWIVKRKEIFSDRISWQLFFYSSKKISFNLEKHSTISAIQDFQPNLLREEQNPLRKNPEISLLCSKIGILEQRKVRNYDPHLSTWKPDQHWNFSGLIPAFESSNLSPE